jgi:hypothetical protein
VAAAGRGGAAARAYFVGAPGGAAGRDLNVYEVSFDPYSVTSQALPGTAAVPAAKPLLADVDGDGVEDLVLLDTGAGIVFRGAAAGGGLSFETPGTAFAAAGVPFATVRLAPGGKDLLAWMGNDLAVIWNAGGLTLR